MPGMTGPIHEGAVTLASSQQRRAGKMPEAPFSVHGECLSNEY